MSTLGLSVFTPQVNRKSGNFIFKVDSNQSFFVLNTGFLPESNPSETEPGHSTLNMCYRKGQMAVLTQEGGFTDLGCRPGKEGARRFPYIESKKVLKAAGHILSL